MMRELSLQQAGCKHCVVHHQTLTSHLNPEPHKRTFLASSADTPPFSSMTEAMDLATPTAELPAPKNTMRASFSSVPCAFMPLMNLRKGTGAGKLQVALPGGSGPGEGSECPSHWVLTWPAHFGCPPCGHDGAGALDVVVEAQHLLPHALQDLECLQRRDATLSAAPGVESWPECQPCRTAPRPCTVPDVSGGMAPTWGAPCLFESLQTGSARLGSGLSPPCKTPCSRHLAVVTTRLRRAVIQKSLMVADDSLYNFHLLLATDPVLLSALHATQTAYSIVPPGHVHFEPQPTDHWSMTHEVELVVPKLFVVSANIEHCITATHSQQ